MTNLFDVSQLTATESLAQMKCFMKGLKCGKQFNSTYGTQCYLYNANGAKVGLLERFSHMTDITRSDARVSISCADKQSYRLCVGGNHVYSEYPSYDDSTESWTWLNQHRLYIQE